MYTHEICVCIHSSHVKITWQVTHYVCGLLHSLMPQIYRAAPYEDSSTATTKSCDDLDVVFQQAQMLKQMRKQHTRWMIAGHGMKTASLLHCCSCS